MPEILFSRIEMRFIDSTLRFAARFQDFYEFDDELSEHWLSLPHFLASIAIQQMALEAVS